MFRMPLRVVTYRAPTELVDPATGERHAVVKPRSGLRMPKDHGFTKLFEAFALAIQRDLRYFTDPDVRVLLWFQCKTLEVPFKGEGWVTVRVEDIMRVTGISRRAVFKSLERLQHGFDAPSHHTTRYLEQRRFRSPQWRIRPVFMFKGVLARYVAPRLVDE
jgi:hypothetical protein